MIALILAAGYATRLYPLTINTPKPLLPVGPKAMIDYITDDFEAMAGGAVSEFGTGGMATKVAAARIANDAGADTVICNADDMKKLRHVLEGRNEGTLFRAHKNENFHLIDYLNKKHEEALS